MFHYATTSNQKQRLLLAVPEFLKGNDLFPSLAEWRIWIFRLIFSVTSLWSLRSSVKRKNEDHHDPRKLWRSSWKHVAVIRRVNFENLPGDVVRLEQRGCRYRNGENPRKRSSREGWIEVWVEIGKERERERVKKRCYLRVDEISGEARSAGLGEAGDDGVHLSLQGAALVHQRHGFCLHVRRHHCHVPHQRLFSILTLIYCMLYFTDLFCTHCIMLEWNGMVAHSFSVDLIDYSTTLFFFFFNTKILRMSCDII